MRKDNEEKLLSLYAEALENQNDKRKPKFKKKFAAAAVALSLIALTCLAVIAVDPIVNVFNYLLANPDVPSVTVDGVTYKIIKDTQRFDSIHELKEAENIDVIFPAILPDGINLEFIKKYNSDDSSEYYFVFNTDTLFYHISEKHNIAIQDTGNFDKIITDNGLEIYFLEINGLFEALFYHGGYEYIVTCCDYDLLLEILDQI